MKCEWILCPVCGSKTRNKIRKDTVKEEGNNKWLK
ncbi:MULTISPECIES: cysteine-rich KTR domain-containing protein [Campylobacter]|nr:cysteine-rich KTR domain-containing protein [Campylobacter jejuni]